MDEVNIFTILAVYRDVYVVSAVFCYETTCKRIEVRESCREWSFEVIDNLIAFEREMKLRRAAPTGCSAEKAKGDPMVLDNTHCWIAARMSYICEAIFDL